jgi:hypothetical protein
MRCKTRAEEIGNPRRSGARAETRPRLTHKPDRAKKAKVKGTGEPTPRKRLKKVPKLAPLRYGTVYCELGKERLVPGDLVAWWKVRGYGGRRRWAVYCATCHWENVRKGQALR